VAEACAKSRPAVAIPCRRVVRNNGALSGYAWGVERKRVLFDSEASQGRDIIPVRAQAEIINPLRLLRTEKRPQGQLGSVNSPVLRSGRVDDERAPSRGTSSPEGCAVIAPSSQSEAARSVVA
jgi:6-O-methylguanine DNA methyltransferase, DNA binding domain